MAAGKATDNALEVTYTPGGTSRGGKFLTGQQLKWLDDKTPSTARLYKDYFKKKYNTQ